MPTQGDRLKKLLIGDTNSLPPESRRWNLFIYYTLTHTLEEMPPEVVPAAIAFDYDSLTNNGGHADYLYNPSVASDRVYDSLITVGAEAYASNFRNAAAHLNHPIYDYQAEDDLFFSLQPTLTDILMDYVRENLKDISFE